MREITIESGMEYFTKYQNEKPLCIRPKKSVLSGLKKEWYTQGFYDFAPFELMLSRHYTPAVNFQTEPEEPILSSCNVAYIESDKSHPLFTVTKRSDILCRNYYYEENLIIIINFNVEEECCLGSSIIQYDEFPKPVKAVGVYDRGRVSSLFEYVYEGNRCVRIDKTTQSDKAFECRSYTYNFFYTKDGVIEKIVMDGNDVIYQMPKKFSVEKALNAVNTTFAKEIVAVVKEEEERTVPFVGMCLYYNLASRFNPISISLISSDEFMQLQSAVSNGASIDIWNPQDFEELIDISPNESKSREACNFLENHWFPSESTINELMMEYSQLILELLKKKYKTLRFAYACDYDDLFLKENIDSIRSKFQE